LISNVSEHVAKNCGPVAFFSLEMSDEILFDRHTVGRLNTSLTHLRAFAQNHHEEIRDAVYQLSELPIFVNSNPCQSGGSIASQCHQIKRKHGLSLVMIDYLQLVQPDDKRAPRAQQVGLLSRGFKALSKTLGVPVILLSQLNRECEKRNEKKPTLSDLRDSGEIEQDADVVTFIYRPAVYFPDKHKESEAELIIPKNRFGSVGSVNLLWDGPSMTFKSFEDDVVGFDSIDMAF
jgi:replicative DNA helicase